MHKPCIVSDRVGQSKYITHKKDGFIVKAGNYKELKDLFIYIHDNFSLIDNMKELSYQIYLKYFKYENYINNVISNINNSINDKFTGIKPAFKEKNITVIFSSNNKFVNYLGVAIKSLICNSSINYNYDILICHKDLTEKSQRKILFLANNEINISIRFVNMQQYLRFLPEQLLYVTGYVPPETYNKFFLTKILSGHKRCVYLDSDIVILDDIAKLHNIDLDGKVIGASLNIANIDAAYRNKKIKGQNIRQYIINTLGISDYRKYFQAGVIVVDIEKAKEIDMLSICLDRLKEIKTPIYFDQCIYNSIFYNNVKFFSTSWNHVWYIQDFRTLRQTLPTCVYKDFVTGTDAPQIVHYAGSIKAHHYPLGNLAEYFWKYAKLTDFYHEILFDSVKIWQKQSSDNLLPQDTRDVSLLVHLHLYYVSQLKYFINKLQALNNHNYDLYITVTKQEDAEIVSIFLKTYSMNANIYVLPNIGYDIYPFVFVINSVNLNKYDYVLKIHTKNERNMTQSFVYNIEVPYFTWRNKLVDALIRSVEVFEKNLKAFEQNPKLGMIGCKDFIFDIRNNNEINNYQLNNFKKKFNIQSGFHYVAGSMFLCKSTILHKLKSLNLSQNDFAPSQKTKDHNNFAHVIERVLGLIVEDCNFEIDDPNFMDEM